MFSKPYSENPAAAARSAGAAALADADARSGRTFNALSALASSRTYRPVSCMHKRHRPWFAGSARSSEKRSAAASVAAAPSFSRSARCLSTPAAPAAAAAPTSAARVVSRASCFASRRARSSSRSRASNSAGLRSVASAPHRATTSRRRRPSGDGDASAGTTHSLAPSWQMTASSAQNCSSSTNSHAPSSLVVGLTYATPTCLCSALTATRTAATTGASAISPPRYSSSSKAPSFPGLALFARRQPCRGISSYSSTVRSVPSSSRSRSTVSNRLLFRVTPANALSPWPRYFTTVVVL